MIKLLMAFLLTKLFLAGTVCAQANQSTTLIIIGVSHTETKFMNSDSLLLILQKIRPAVILDEMQSPSGFYTNDKQLRALPATYQIRTKLGIGKKLSPEKMVLYAYRNFDSGIIIRPFDMYIEDRNKYIRDDKKWEDQFFAILNNDKYSQAFTPYQKDLFLQYVRLNNYQFDITRQSYFDMNQPDVSDSLRKMMVISDPLIMSVVDSLPVAASLKPYYEKNKVFWQERNKSMASNIMEYIRQYPGKRIVVLTGLLHKHYLMDLLQQSPQRSVFRMVEFYDPVLAEE